MSLDVLGYFGNGLKAEYIDYTYTDETVDPSGQVYVLKSAALL